MAVSIINNTYYKVMFNTIRHFKRSVVYWYNYYFYYYSKSYLETAVILEMPFADNSIKPSLYTLYKYYWFAELYQYFNFKLVQIGGFLFGPQKYTIKNQKFAIQKLNISFSTYISSVIKSPERALIRKAIKNNYYCKQISYDNYLKDIQEINKSKEQRQGRAMEEDYLAIRCRESLLNQYSQGLLTFGCFTENGKLVAYYIFELMTNFFHTAFGIGHKEHLSYGIMNFLYAYSVSELSSQFKNKYLVYGPIPDYNLDGLSKYKKNVGCKSLPIVLIGTKSDMKNISRFTELYKLHGDSPLNLIIENKQSQDECINSI